ncbi:hypothetical protein Taro_037460 [Colocasia esculenta]|uniref:Uncharacterized protein n=1 Tax=Colocasia esculenta TaxID=4460 RepID=A0A843W9T9_COLES|nr:hypothetical protein [Colocasia esculenta]
MKGFPKLGVSLIKKNTVLLSGELGGERKRSSVKKRLMMRLRMDGYDASLCRSSWVSTLECLGGDYEYIDIVMEEEHGAPTRLIVDVAFRSQFELARPTLAYAQLSGALPSVFVGKEEKIKKIVPLLGSAAQDATSGSYNTSAKSSSALCASNTCWYMKGQTVMLANTAISEG